MLPAVAINGEKPFDRRFGRPGAVFRSWGTCCALPKQSHGCELRPAARPHRHSDLPRLLQDECLEALFPKGDVLSQILAERRLEELLNAALKCRTKAPQGRRLSHKEHAFGHDKDRTPGKCGKSTVPAREHCANAARDFSAAGVAPQRVEPHAALRECRTKFERLGPTGGTASPDNGASEAFARFGINDNDRVAAQNRLTNEVREHDAFSRLRCADEKRSAS